MNWGKNTFLSYLSDSCSKQSIGCNPPSVSFGGDRQIDNSSNLFYFVFILKWNWFSTNPLAKSYIDSYISEDKLNFDVILS